MSRGFVKEEDQEEAPFIPARAALPAGATNYVTPFGFEQLQKEKKDLEKERANLQTGSDAERRRALAVIDGKLNLLQERISSARILKPEEQSADEVRFGAKVALRSVENKMLQEFQIVGIDEADVKQQKIAFVAPIARAVTGKRVGGIAEIKLGNELRKLEVIKIGYN